MPHRISFAPVSDGELAAAAQTRLLFGHQSVGADILRGVAALYDRTDVAPWRIVDARLPLDLAQGYLAHCPVGRNREPVAKLREFKDLVDGRIDSQVDIALVKFCYADVDATTDVPALFKEYSDTMDALTRKRPQLALLYCTVPLTTDRSWKGTIKAALGRNNHAGPADNLARDQFNNLVRTRYADTKRLFDIAAVEAAPGGPATTRKHKGRHYSVLNKALSSDGGHLNAAGARAAAAELVRLVAAAP